MSQRLLLPTRDLVLAERLSAATTLSRRLRGLIGTTLEQGEGLLLMPCKQVHTLGMRYAIDVIFCDRDWVVVEVVRHMKPRRVGPVVWRARCAIELPEGAADQVKRGDRLVPDPDGL
ncbi:MAG: DUF192 domain-containing protein [Actinomycetota bacterium]|nr:DUF192 domain-containing protein [Actinomycetota bacterium]